MARIPTGSGGRGAQQHVKKANAVSVKAELNLSSGEDSDEDDADGSAETTSFHICDRCGRDFLSQSALKAHLILHESEGSTSNGRTGPCNKCKVEYRVDHDGRQASQTL